MNLRQRRKLLKDAGVEEICSACGQLPFWNNKPLTLQIDHIDGNSMNDDLNNLRYLCPNCHTQTETFGTRRFKKSPKLCADCGKEIQRKSTRCQMCANRFRIQQDRPIIWPSDEELQKLVSQSNYSQVARSLGVSITAVRKRMVYRNKEH